MDKPNDEDRDLLVGTAVAELPVPASSPDFFECLKARAQSEGLGIRGSGRDSVRRRTPRLSRLAVLVGVALVSMIVGGLVGGIVARASTDNPLPQRQRSVLASPVLAFRPAEGWNVVQTALPAKVQGNSQVVWTTNVPFSDNQIETEWPREILGTLPREGVVILASLAKKVADPKTYPERDLPLTLQDGYFLDGDPCCYETQPAANVSTAIIYARVRDQYLFVQVWFGQNDPGSARRSGANEQLGRLLVPDPNWTITPKRGP